MIRSTGKWVLAGAVAWLLAANAQAQLQQGPRRLESPPFLT